MADTVDQSGVAAEKGVASGERRAQPRTQVLETSAGIVAVELDQGDSGIILDLTPDGMMVQCLSPLIAGEPRTVSFTLPGSSAPMRLSAVVVWSDPEGRAGLRFNFSGSGSRKELQTWLAESRRSIFSPTSGFFSSHLPEHEAYARPEPPPVSAPAVQKLGAEPVPDPVQPFSLSAALAGKPAAAAPVEHSAFHDLEESPDELQRGVNAISWTIVEEISRLTPAQGAVVAVAQGSAITCRASWGSAPGVGAKLQPEIGLSGECFRTGQVIVCRDTDADQRVPSSVSKRLNLKSIVVVPVLGPHGTVGLLEALASEKNAFSDSHVRILTRLAASLAEVLNQEIEAKAAAPAAAKAEPKLPAKGLVSSAPAAASGIAGAAVSGGVQPVEPARANIPVSGPPRAGASPAAKMPAGVFQRSPGVGSTPAPNGGTRNGATQSGFSSGAGVAPKRAPEKKPLPPALNAPKAPEPKEDVVPLAAALQSNTQPAAQEKNRSAFPPLSQARSTSSPKFGSVEAPESKPSIAKFGIAAIVVIAVLAASWTLTHRAPSEGNSQTAEVVVQEPSQSAQGQNSGAQRAGEIAINSQLPAKETEPAALDNRNSERRPTPPSTLSSSSSSSSSSSPAKAAVKPRASEPEQIEAPDVVVSIAEDIRQPGAVSRPVTAPVEPVQPPRSVGANASSASALNLPTGTNAPRLAAPPPVTPPQLIRRVEPQRPSGNLTGTVVLSATIGTDGRPADIKAISGNPLLVSAAISAFRTWQYEPARRNGTAIPSQLEVRFIFRQ